jgi:ribosomal protein S18 acetylase RimI-like enzyme
MVEIREYDPARDRPAVRACFVELQDFERGLDPRMPPGEPVADAYLELTFRRCDEFGGVALVADVEGRVVGLVVVWTRYRSSELIDNPQEHGYIPDLVVSASHRGLGIGRSLLRAAEARAREAGAASLRLSVKAGNIGAQALYSAEGFVESDIYLEKAITDSGARAVAVPSSKQAQLGPVADRSGGQGALIRIAPILACSDVLACLDFCAERLGFEREWVWGDPPSDGAVRRDEVGLHFVRDSRLAERSRGFEAMVFVHDVDSLHAEHLERKAPIVSALETKPWHVREYTVALPSGFLLRFAQDVEPDVP